MGADQCFTERSFQGPSKKRKITHTKSSQSEGKSKAKAKVAKKERASEQTTIPIPDQGDEFELSDQDLELVNEYGTAASFLGSLDEKGIARCVRHFMGFLRHLIVYRDTGAKRSRIGFTV